MAAPSKEVAAAAASTVNDGDSSGGRGELETNKVAPDQTFAARTAEAPATAAAAAEWKDADEAAARSVQPGLLSVGTRVNVAGYKSDGTLRFVGMHKTKGTLRYGVELDLAVGNNNGVVGGYTYFKAEAKHGVLTVPGKCSPVRALLLSSAGKQHATAAAASSSNIAPTHDVTITSARVHPTAPPPPRTPIPAPRSTAAKRSRWDTPPATTPRRRASFRTEEGAASPQTPSTQNPTPKTPSNPTKRRRHNHGGAAPTAITPRKLGLTATAARHTEPLCSTQGQAEQWTARVNEMVLKMDNRATFRSLTKVVTVEGRAGWRCTVLIKEPGTAGTGQNYTQDSRLSGDHAKLEAAHLAIRKYPWPSTIAEWHANTSADLQHGQSAVQKIRKRRKRGTGGGGQRSSTASAAKRVGSGGGGTAHTARPAFSAADAASIHTTFGVGLRHYTVGQELAIEEDLQHEFKTASTASRRDWVGWQQEKTVKGEQLPEGIAIKNVIAFLNSSAGGTLYLGVLDNGSVQGVDGFNRESKDYFRLKLTQLTRTLIRPTVSVDLVQATFIPVVNKVSASVPATVLPAVCAQRPAGAHTASVFEQEAQRTHARNARRYQSALETPRPPSCMLTCAQYHDVTAQQPSTTFVVEIKVKPGMSKLQYTPFESILSKRAYVKEVRSVGTPP